MATTSAREFEDDTAFERLVLDRAVPLVLPDAGSTVIDLRGEVLSVNATVRPKTVHVMVGDTLGGASLTEVRPLLFGAAWKVLDLLVEYAMITAGRSPDAGRDRYSISGKVGACRAGLPALPEFAEQLRNTLVHRQAHVDANGSLTPTESGKPIGRPLTADEQETFCRAVQRAAQAVLSGRLDMRSANDLAFCLDALAAHHGAGTLGGVDAPRRTFIVQVTPEETESEAIVDIDAVRVAAQQAVSDVPYFDLEIHLADSRILTGRLEDADSSPAHIDKLNPPSWLSWM
jgi:hypothetical protein